MIVIKYVNLLLIIAVCTYMGFSKSKQFSKRLTSLKNIKSSLNIFKAKIEFTYEPIKDIFNEISKIVYKNKENIFKTFCSNLENKDITVAWNEAIEITDEGLNLDDKEVLFMLGKMLGKTDKSGQISEIELVNNFLNKQIEDAEERKSKNEKMYKTLGVVSGLAIVIILV